MGSAIVGISGFPGHHPGWAQYRALGAASLECCAVAEGVLDAYMVVGRSTLYGWDYLAGLLICREAGAAERERDELGLVVRDAVEPTAHRGGDGCAAGEAGGRGDAVMSDDGRDAGALRARKTWRTLEPLHGMIYFVPEAGEAYSALGVDGRAGYFASRAAPMGAVGADAVISTFFNFNPKLVHDAIPAAWQAAAPEALVAARFGAVDAAFRRLLGGAALASGEMRRAALLARTAAQEAGRRPEARPLAAAHAGHRLAGRAAPAAVARAVDPARVPG